MVHFLCGHSYHWDCIPNDNECTLCRNEHHQIMKMLRSHEESGQNFDQFTKRLEGAKDRFSVIAELFGHNVFHKVHAETERDGVCGGGGVLPHHLLCHDSKQIHP